MKLIPVPESCNPIEFSFTVDKTTVQPPSSGVIQSRVTPNGIIPQSRFSRSNLQMLPTMIKRMRKPVRVMAWGVKKLNIDRRFSMKVSVIVFGRGTVPTRRTKTGFCRNYPQNMGRACASTCLSLTIRVWLVCEEHMHYFVPYVAIGNVFAAAELGGNYTARNNLPSFLVGSLSLVCERSYFVTVDT